MDVGNSNFRYIPFSALERLGLVVIDDGDGGADVHTGVKAVDALDTKLVVMTNGGDVLYDGLKDTRRFPEFYRQMQEAIAARPVTVFLRPDPTDKGWVKFDRGAIQESRRERTAFFTAGPQGLHTSALFYVRGQVAKGTAHFDLCGAKGCRVLAQSIDLRTLTVTEDTHDKGNISRPQTTSFLPSGGAARAIHLTPHPWGWHIRLDDLSIRVTTDSRAGIFHAARVAVIVGALARIPYSALALFRQFRRETYGSDELVFHSLDISTKRMDTELVRQIARDRVSGYLTIMGIPVMEISGKTAHKIPPSMLRELNAEWLKKVDQFSGAFNVALGEIFLLQGTASLRIVLHEVGHGMELMLGPDFSKDAAELFATVMAQIQKETRWSSEERDRWVAQMRNGNQNRFGEDPVTNGALKRTVDAGWLPTDYSGSSFREFWAECFSLAFLSPEADPSKSKEKRYLPIVNAIRVAFTKGKTPDHIRRIFREMLLKM